MIKHLPLLLFFGLAWGHEDLLIKKAESSINFKSGQKLIIRYTNEELNVVFNNESIEGEFKSVNNDFLMISTGNTVDKKISISSINRISVPSKIPANISFKQGACMGAVIHLIPLTIISIDNKDPFEFMVGIIIGTPVMSVVGGLTSYIVPKFRKTKVYLIQKNEWEIVND